MVEYLQKLSDVLNTLPSYVGEGIMELLIMIIGGLILGYITSNYLYKINELNRVEGWLLEKRIPIYEELFKHTEQMMELCMVTPAEFTIVVPVLEKYDLKLDKTARQVSNLFMDPDKLAASFLEFDKFAAQNRLFFDTQVAQEVLVLQNYYAILRRMLVLFDERMIDLKIDQKDKVKAVRGHLTITIGVYLSNEFLQNVVKLQNTIRVSMNHLELSHRAKPDYSYDFYQSENGFMMTRLKDSKALRNNVALTQMIAEYTAMGMIAGGIKSI